MKESRAKKITINDVARIAGVSKTTVSRVINNIPDGVSISTREQVKKVIAELGFVPSSPVRRIDIPHTKTIGVIICGIKNPFYHQMLNGIADIADANGYGIFICNTNSNRVKEQSYIVSLLEKQVDGIILQSCVSYMKDDFIKMIHEHPEIPIVLVDRVIRGFDSCDAVIVDNEVGGYDGTQFFLKHGHKNIVFLSGPSGANSVAERTQGYYRAMQEAMLTPVVLKGNLDSQSGYEMGLSILKNHPKTTAIFAANDIVALGCMKALLQNGVSIPEQMEILGFDDIETNQLMVPALSSMSQSAYIIGKKASELLLDKLKEPTLQKKDIIVRAKLTLRDSTSKDEYPKTDECGLPVHLP